MPWQAPTRNLHARDQNDDTVVDGCRIRCSLKIERELAALSTANKNRVLLALNSVIAVQLEALETDNEQ